MRKINVNTVSAKYPVYVGEGLTGRIFPLLKTRERVFLLTSPEIWALWGKHALSSFPQDRQPEVIFLPAGERYKRMGEVERLGAELSMAGADRSSLLVAFGGGIIGDVGGFLAAIYMRGIEYVQMPTTLLAQVDSSVGGKTGVNLTTGKNLMGSFHHPRAVYADIGVLGTLPDRELRAGLYESIKAGIIRDAKLFAYMERNAEAILARDVQALERVIVASVRMKAEVVGIDERESGVRMVLNLGHTVGHAIEAVTKYRVLLHGEAVGWGMLAALEIARLRGTVTDAQADRIERVIAAYGPLPTFQATTAALVAATAHDKKHRAGKRRFVLPVGIGASTVVEDVSEAELTSAVERMLGRR